MPRGRSVVTSSTVCLNAGMDAQRPGRTVINSSLPKSTRKWIDLSANGIDTTLTTLLALRTAASASVLARIYSTVGGASDADYSYACVNVARSVCLCVGHRGEPRKNGWINQIAVCEKDSRRAKVTRTP